MANKQLIFTTGHKMPTASEMAEKNYCKFHNSWRHSTNNCVIFRNIMQNAIEDGRLKFPEKIEVMGVDGNPFPKVMATNVASLASEHPKKKVGLTGPAASGKLEIPKAEASMEKTVAELERQLQEAQITLIQKGCCPKCKIQNEGCHGDFPKEKPKENFSNSD
ncbi:uncharacterized protein LOC132272617 [Cornus florida]|uniref:uncharacterized protein LOC132272617 n=1 Tax=Cornus florida TaxID=4283 RepID=UPI0028995C8E|nr:uncharacterized protein LOC132272617 [Cornus florida]